ncbi:MAG: hypothetical protein ACRDQ5_11890 [Sciscionella sp.]
MNCAVCGRSGVGYWCSEEHQQKWFADQIRIRPERQSAPSGARVIWGHPTRDRQAPPAA